ncbi:MAG: NAD(P)/FAD-dependent oxidoreductase [Gammaproteobacteria bacterium]|nr:MAG: NAD(P)/FAD-dependent oxidoreductase [Gammaproteobacteria bacterium]
MTFDVIVIGSGPGGYRAAVLGALRGMKVAIVEKGLWGGCCLNRGCVPKKTWYASALQVKASMDAAERGLYGTLEGDLNQAWQYQHRMVARIRESYLDYLRRLGIALHEGHARLCAPHRVQVGEASLEGKHIILATGAKPFVPPFIPLGDRVLTTDGLFEAPPPPGKAVALLGGGAVAVEFAFIFTLLGKEVTWLSRSPMLGRSPLSAPALKALADSLDQHGIRLKIADIRSVVPEDGGVRIELEKETVAVDWLCLALGRRPYTQDLGLEAAGIGKDERGFVQRNAALQTALPHIYAIGDCASPYMTANQALDDARIAIDHILTGKGEKDPLWVPTVLYSAVEIARIGLNEDQAEERGHEPAVGFAAFETSPCARAQGDTAGFVRLIADMDTAAFLGGEIVGREAGELIHLLSLPAGKETLQQLVRGRFNHPARAEELQNATETLASRWGLPVF